MQAAKQIIQAEIDRLVNYRKQLNAAAGQTQSNQVRIAYVSSADSLNAVIDELNEAFRVIVHSENPALELTPRSAIRQIPDPVQEPELIPSADDAELQQLANETHDQFLDDQQFEQQRDQDI